MICTVVYFGPEIFVITKLCCCFLSWWDKLDSVADWIIRSFFMSGIRPGTGFDIPDIWLDI